MAAPQVNTPSAETLIELCYLALDQAERWQELIDGIVAAVHRTQGQIWVAYPHEPAFSVQVSTGITPEAHREYRERWCGEDPWLTRVNVFHEPVGQIRCSHDICPDGVLEATAFYREYLARHRWHYGCGARLSLGPHQAAILTLLGPRESGPMKHSDLALLNRVVPHLCRAVAIHEQLAHLRLQNAALGQLSQRPDDAVFLVNSAGYVLYTNDAAAAMGQSGQPIRIRNGAIAAASPEVHRSLIRAIQRATLTGATLANASSKFVLASRGNKHSHLAIIRPVTVAGVAPLNMAPATALLTIIDPEVSTPELDPEILRQGYGLSPAEIRIVEHLVEGLSPKEIAEQSGHAISTVRSQLRSIFTKTSTSRQPELIQLVLTVAGNRV